MNIISEKFNSKVTALKNSFQSNKKINHQGIKGKMNEEELHSLIREVISERYKISNGVIVNNYGIQSNETDFFIYDNNILPAFIKNTITFVPVESVKYAFEIKTTINKKEIITTINKFDNLIALGYKGNRTLFAFSSDINGSELDRYKKYDVNFFIRPIINIICISNKAYYFYITDELYLKDFVTINDVANSLGLGKDKINNFSEILDNAFKDDNFLNKMKRSELILLIRSYFQVNEFKQKNWENLDSKINGFNFNEIKFKVHKWIGIEKNDNNVELSLLSGISNTLSHHSFGRYLLNEDSQGKCYAVCYEDMWGNISYEYYNKNGLPHNCTIDGFEINLNEKNPCIKIKIKEEKV